MSEIRNLRERINIRLYTIKPAVRLFLDMLSIAAIAGGFAVILNFFGYRHNQEHLNDLLALMWIINYFFVFKYVMMFLLDFDPLKYLRQNKKRKVITIILICNLIIKLLTGEDLLLSISLGHDVVLFFILSIFFAIFSILVIAHADDTIGHIHLQPAALLSLSFLVLITMGAIALSLPQMTTNKSITLIDALFTSTSASCVTGLSVQDTAHFFTLKGQFVIMILIQMGGLNMLIVATFITFLMGKSGSLESSKIISNLMDTDNNFNLRKIVLNVITYSILIETLGTILIFFSWGEAQVFNSLKQKIFFSVFHSISAFNNAGFSLFSQGLYEPAIRHQYAMQLVIAFQIILGGLGFIVLQDVFSYEKIRSRVKHPWKKKEPHTKMVLWTSLVLILIGMTAFIILENNRTLQGYSFTGKVVTAFFQSVTLRTAGFNTVDISSLTKPILLLFMVLMFIGASPGSTGGGIKTTTFIVALKSAIANIRGKEHVEAYKRNISWHAVNKTYAIIAISVSILFLFTFALSISEPEISFVKIIFECFSAMGTVGLSMGITPDLSIAGKVIIILLMYIGRLGTLTLGIALSKKTKYKNYRYPDTHVMIG